MSTNPIKLSDRIKEISYTMGTSDLGLAGPVAGFSSFASAYSSGDSLFYAVTDGSHYEIGSGIYGSGYIVRFPIKSTNSNSLVNFSEGVKEVYVTYPATHAVYMGSGLAGVDIPSSSGMAFWLSPNMLGYDDDITWDNTNKRLGIRKLQPGYAIDIGGNGSESVIRSSGLYVGPEGIYFPPINNGDNAYLGGTQLTHYEKNELDQKALDLFLIGGLTGSNAVLELSGVANQYILFKQQPAGTVFAGPPSGCTPPCDPGYPSFRLLTIEDVPALLEVSGILDDKIGLTLTAANNNTALVSTTLNNKINTVSGITIGVSGFFAQRIPSDGDKGDIVLSNNASVFTIDTGAVTTAKIANLAVTSPKLAFSHAGTADGRLTTESNVPVSTGDRTSQTVLYYTPYLGNNISLYNTTSSAWETINFSQVQIVLSSVIASNNYDVFGYNNNGTLALELSAAWTNSTTRNESLTFLNGVFVKTTNYSRRYLGTIRSSVNTATEDSQAKRFVWNYDNRVQRKLKRLTGSSTPWTYSSPVWRRLNETVDQTCQIDIVSGVNSSIINLNAGALVAMASNSATIIYIIGISKDGLISSPINGAGDRFASANASYQNQLSALYTDYTGLGYHNYIPVEYVTNGNIQAPQLYGGEVSPGQWAGIQAVWEC